MASMVVTWWIVFFCAVHVEWPLFCGHTDEWLKALDLRPIIMILIDGWQLGT